MNCCKQDEKGEWQDVYGDPVRPRRNGYECPPDALQVGAWATIIALAILHYMVQIPYLKGAFFIVTLVVTSVLVGGVVVTKIVLELMHQEDPAVFAKEPPRLSQEELTPEAAPPGTEPCVFCRRFVRVGCKHCSVCDKCVPDFDHHCRWLNSCVGGRNYSLFAAFMGFAWVGMAWVVAISIYVIQYALRDITRFKREMQERAYRSNPKAFPAIMVFNFVCLALAVAGCCALGKLVTYHIYLKWTGQSTYGHIQKKRQRKRERGAYVSTSSEQRRPSCCSCIGLRKRRDFKKHGKKGASPGEGTGETHDPAAVTSGGSRSGGGTSAPTATGRAAVPDNQQLDARSSDSSLFDRREPFVVDFSGMG